MGEGGGTDKKEEVGRWEAEREGRGRRWVGKGGLGGIASLRQG